MRAYVYAYMHVCMRLWRARTSRVVLEVGCAVVHLARDDEPQVCRLAMLLDLGHRERLRARRLDDDGCSLNGLRLTEGLLLKPASKVARPREGRVLELEGGQARGFVNSAVDLDARK